MSKQISILVAGLGRHASADALSTTTNGASTTTSTTAIQQKVAASVAESRAAGYDVQNMELDPSDPTAAIKALSDKLQSQRWDGFMVGYGLRGVKANTPVFEQVVNCCRETSPQTRFLFSDAPDEIYRTIQRSYE